MVEVSRAARHRHRVVVPVLLAILLAVAPGVRAQDEPQEESPGAMALEGVGKLMRALEALMLMIPQYEMPELNDNGDIIIRRKRSGEEDSAPSDKPPEVDETST